MAVWTVQKLIYDRMEIAVYCQCSACGHHSTLDLELLKEKLGPDAPAMRDDLVPTTTNDTCLPETSATLSGV